MLNNTLGYPQLLAGFGYPYPPVPVRLFGYPSHLYCLTINVQCSIYGLKRPDRLADDRKV